MICTTTTPFAVDDIASLLPIPAARIEMAWRVLLPYFGTHVSFGLGRRVTAPNFFDVIAINVLVELLTKPQDIERAVSLAIDIADEVAVCLDDSEVTNFFSVQQRDSIRQSLDDLLFGDTIYCIHSTRLKRQNRIVESVFEVFAGVQGSLSKTNPSKGCVRLVETQKHNAIA